MEEMELPDLPPARLIEMLERLPLLNGILTHRAQAEAQTTGPDEVSGVTVGHSESRSAPTSPTGTRRGSNDVEHVESTGAVLTGHPALAGLVEFAQI